MRSTIQSRVLPLLLATVLIGCNQLPQDSTNNRPPDSSETIREDEGLSEKDSTNSVEGDRTGKDSELNSEQNDEQSDQKKEPSKPVAMALKPGTYCYETSDEIEDIQVRLSIDSADRVTGNVQGTIHNEESAYYTSYRQLVDGTIDGSNLNVDIATWIEYDQQNRQETWRVSPAELSIDDETLSKANCEQVNKAFQNEQGLEAKDLTENANNVFTKQVFFDSGKSATTVSNAVVRADRDVYTLTAKGGQKMDLAITAIEDNAVFDVVDPSGIILGTELTQETVFLPHTGEYQIIVGGTRGNASYELAIAIE